MANALAVVKANLRAVIESATAALLMLEEDVDVLDEPGCPSCGAVDAVLDSSCMGQDDRRTCGKCGTSWTAAKGIENHG